MSKYFDWKLVLMALWAFVCVAMMFAPFAFPENPPWWLLTGYMVLFIACLGTAKPISDWFERNSP